MLARPKSPATTAVVCASSKREPLINRYPPKNEMAPPATDLFSRRSSKSASSASACTQEKIGEFVRQRFNFRSRTSFPANKIKRLARCSMANAHTSAGQARSGDDSEGRTARLDANLWCRRDLWRHKKVCCRARGGFRRGRTAGRCRGGKHDLLQRAHTVHRLLLPPTRLSHSTHSVRRHLFTHRQFIHRVATMPPLAIKKPAATPAGLLGASLSRLPTIDKRRRIKCRQLDACAWPRP